jgi:hypothetical protein
MTWHSKSTMHAGSSLNWFVGVVVVCECILGQPVPSVGAPHMSDATLNAGLIM